jgi:hypothetical protein
MARKSIGLRLSEAELGQLRSAARARGVSVNAFVRAAVLRAARKPGKGQERGDEDFTSRCRSARFGGGTGPKRGFWQVGSDFAKEVVRQIGKGTGSAGKLRELKDILATMGPEPSRRDYAPLLRWCGRHFPGLVESIPSRRRVRFAEGFCDAHDGGYTRLRR